MIDQDTRFWEVFNEKGESLGLFMYWDLMVHFNNRRIGLSDALTWLRSKNYTWKIVGDICPLEEDSDIEIIQQHKIKCRKREKEREKRRAKKRGFKLENTIKFGKHSGKKIKDLIDNYPSYWNWLIKNNVLLLHPEVKNYYEKLSKPTGQEAG